MSFVQRLLALIIFLPAFLCAPAQTTAATPGSATARISTQPRGEEQERERTEKLPELFQALGVKAGSWVADVGAGQGFHTVRLARRVGEQGRVFAVEISEKALKRLHERIRDQRLENVEIIQGEPDDPKLPAQALDAALIVDAYHEMLLYRAMLQKIRQALKPDGRLVVQDRSPPSDHRQRAREQQVSGHEIAPDLVEQELREAGFEVLERRDPFIQRKPDSAVVIWLLVARPSSN